MAEPEIKPRSVSLDPLTNTAASLTSAGRAAVGRRGLGAPTCPRPFGAGCLDGQEDAKTPGRGSSVGRSGERQGPEEGVEDELRGISLHVGQHWTPGDQASRPTGGFCPAEERPWPQRSPMRALFC